VTRSSQFEIEVLTQTRSDGKWLSFGIGVEQQAPHAIMEIRVRPTSGPPEKGGPNGPRRDAEAEVGKSLSEAEMLAQVNAMLDKRVSEDSFSGVVWVAKNNKPIFRRAVGMANKGYAVPNREDTKFNLGSINKIFTRVAITQLVEQGKISLEDTIGQRLPDYPNKDAAAKVRIKHLLEMQSGIGDFFGPKFDATPKNRIRSISDYMALFADQPLKFEPGSNSAYSNGGYIALGAIIEKVTGQSYYDYVREHIFNPAGMENSDYYEVDKPTDNLATGYHRDAGGARTSNVYLQPARGSSAGGGYSTAEDLLKFSIALQSGKLLGPENSKKIGGRLGIAGGSPGVNAVLESGSKGGYTVIVLSNYDPPSAEEVSKEIRRWLSDVKE
jgi:CubicO group peptidase (beta-lactamase class C family)